MNDDAIRSYARLLTPPELSAFLRLQQQRAAGRCSPWLWLASPAGQQFLASEDGARFIASDDGAAWRRAVQNTFIALNEAYFLCERDARRRLLLLRLWLCNSDGQLWLTGARGQRFLASADGRALLAEPLGAALQSLIGEAAAAARAASVRARARDCECRALGLPLRECAAADPLPALLQYRIAKLRENVVALPALDGELRELLWASRGDGQRWVRDTAEGRAWAAERVERLAAERRDDVEWNRIYYSSRCGSDGDAEFAAWMRTESARAFLSEYAAESEGIGAIVGGLERLAAGYSTVTDSEVCDVFDYLEELRVAFENVSPKCYVSSLKLRDAFIMQRYWFLFFQNQLEPDVDMCISMFREKISEVCNKYLLIKTPLM